MLARQTLRYLPAQVLSPLVQAATVIVWAHLLPAEEVGIATLIMAIQEISYTFFYTWWTTYVLRHLLRFRKDAATAVFLQSEFVAVLAGMSLQAVAVVIAAFAFGRPGISLQSYSIIAIYCLSRSLNLYMSERARADGNISLYTTMQVAVPTLGLLAGCALVVLVSRTATSVLAAFSLAQVLSSVAAVVRTDVGRVALPIRPTLLRTALVFGTPLMLSSLFSIVALNTPRFIVGHTMGLAAVGIFATSYAIGLRVSSFASMLVTAGAYPLVVRRLESEGIAAAYDQLRNNTVLLFAVTTPAALGLFAINSSVIQVLLPQSYWALAATVLPAAAISGMLRDFRSHTTNQVFLLHKRSIVTSVISALDLIFCLAFGFLGARLWGVTGVIMGPLSAAIAGLAASFILSNRLFGFALPTGQILKVVFAAFAMSGIVLLLPKHEGVLWLSISISVGAMIYCVLIGALMPSLCKLVVGKLLKRRR
jgi:O-antigen/teichoic acid export membrane protein